MAQAHEQRRQWAIDRYLAGDPIEDICRALACSKSWLYTWRDRYLATDRSWSAELRRRPRTTPTKTPQRIAQVVVALRQTLAQHGKDCGAAAIQQALAQQGIEPVPSQRTIYRMLTAMQRRGYKPTSIIHPSISEEMFSQYGHGSIVKGIWQREAMRHREDSAPALDAGSGTE